MNKRLISMVSLAIFILAMFWYGNHIVMIRKEANITPPLIGSITVYTDIPSNISTMLAKKYEEEYHVKVNIMPLTEVQMATKLSTLSKKGGDIIITSTENLNIGTAHNRFESVLTPASDLVSDQFKNKDGYWVGVWYDPIVFVERNSFVVTNHHKYDGWFKLIGYGDWKIVIPDFAATRTASNILFSFVEVYGDTRALAYFIALKDHVTQYSKYVSTTIRLVALGEADIGIGSYSDAQTYMKSNYPIEMVYPQDGTPYMLTGIALLKDAQHKVEAKQFMTWLLTPKVAQIMNNEGLYYLYTNPEIQKPKDSFDNDVVLFKVRSAYTDEGKKELIKRWINTVRFN